MRHPICASAGEATPISSQLPDDGTTGHPSTDDRDRLQQIHTCARLAVCALQDAQRPAGYVPAGGVGGGAAGLQVMQVLHH
jgi:hypothetical protein